MLFQENDISIVGRNQKKKKKSTLASLSIYCSLILPSGQAHTVNYAQGRTSMKRLNTMKYDLVQL